MATTARNALRYPILGDTPDFPRDMGYLAADVDVKMVSYWTGTKAERLALGVGQPNRFFKETDTGLLYHDTGAEWEQIMRASEVVKATSGTVYAERFTTAAEMEAGFTLSATRPALMMFTTEEQNNLTIGGSANIGFPNKGASYFVEPGQVVKGTTAVAKHLLVKLL